MPAYRSLVLAASLAAWIGMCTPARAAAPSAAPTPSGVRAAASPRIVLLPVRQLAAAEQASGGCWGRLYASRDFRGDALVVLGPSGITDFAAYAPRQWGSIDSVVVGPSAAVETFDGRDFSVPRARFEAGARIADLKGGALGAQGSVASMRVACRGRDTGTDLRESD